MIITDGRKLSNGTCCFVSNTGLFDNVTHNETVMSVYLGDISKKNKTKKLYIVNFFSLFKMLQKDTCGGKKKSFLSRTDNSSWYSLFCFLS